jgi:hypothetical protein
MLPIETYLNAVVKDIAGQNDKVPVSKFRIEADQIEGKLYAPEWFQYMIYGRGPGKQPPPDRMLAWVQSNPSLFTGSGISEKSLAFLIGRKIGREGTDIFQGKKKGVDLLGAMENAMPELLKDLGEEEKLKIQTSFSKAI